MGIPLLSVVLFITVVNFSFAHGYTWPNPHLDELESQRYDRLGFNARDLASGVNPCDLFLFESVEPGTSGRLNAADWIRTAYHDMATHNVSDGTGGMDASIRLELDRPENTGLGFEDTLFLMTEEANRYASLADVLALALVVAVEQCGGPKIDFRGGRVDANIPNPGRVPLPSQNLSSHTAAFARQGFTQSEMIGLVACGHTFGGVQSVSFPDIVPSGTVHFDSSFSTFDNRIATEYLSGTTVNPLVVGPDLTNSDKRIFSSDGNKTISSFTNPAVFANTCANLYSRMIDTVPRGVQLTDVIDPLPVKPQDVALTYMGDGTLLLIGEVRFWDMQEDSNREVHITWSTRNGAPCSGCSGKLNHTSDQVSSFTAGGLTTQSLWYSFSNNGQQGFVIDESNSISKFSFQVVAGGHTQIENQGGVGFAIQDVVMLAVSSCQIVSNIKIDIAVRRGYNPSRVYIEADDFNNGIPTVNTIDVPGPPSVSLFQSYAIWSVIIPRPSRGWNIAADVGSTKYATVNLDNRGFSNCV